ncbi:MAG: hypothetical protein CSA62_07150 [Planctomycetota bacterium]|nr:MAG: hypothetical protein CSA62_07150 [Planctomycetota bacterium]
MPEFVMPSWRALCTASFEEKIRELGCIEQFFQAISLEKVVWIDWQSWDPDAPEPRRIPGTGEPEDYILRGRGSNRARKAVGELREIVPRECRALELLPKHERVAFCRVKRELFVSDLARGLLVDARDAGMLELSDV